MKVLKSLIRNITTKMNNSQKIDALFQPNELGVSRRVSIGEVIAAGIRWSNNGNIRNGIPWNSKRYVWDVFRQNPEKRTSKVVELQMIGLRDDPSKKLLTTKTICTTTRGFCLAEVRCFPTFNRSATTVIS